MMFNTNSNNDHTNTDNENNDEPGRSLLADWLSGSWRRNFPQVVCGQMATETIRLVGWGCPRYSATFMRSVREMMSPDAGPGVSGDLRGRRGHLPGRRPRALAEAM